LLTLANQRWKRLILAETSRRNQEQRQERQPKCSPQNWAPIRQT
jgi:hypothetical protein